jgi:DNA processing protein
MTILLRARDDRYSPLLREISSPPDLHVWGAVSPDDALAIALVGSRRATAYGLEVAERLAVDLASRGITVVSGLARGIDTAAHRGALAAGGRTIAVLGSGIDTVYPPENLALARQIAGSGAVVSQFPPGTPPLPGNFPVRNRTIAGLVLGVVVVEAAERSGALITAAFAADLGREVLAVPGRITSDASQGTNRLIQEGAKLVRDWTDIVQELPEPWRGRVREPSVPAPENPPLPPGSDEARVLATLEADEPQHIEQVIARTGLGAGRVAAVLATLELGGWAAQRAGQRWVPVPPGVRRA